LFGYTVVDAPTIIATHISEVIKRHASELIGRQELQQLLDTVVATHPKVVDELVPSILNLGTILRVIKSLLKENVSIRDLRTVLETLADYGSVTKDPEALTEFVRQALARSIVDQYKREDDTLCLLSLDRRVEETVADSVQVTEHGSYLAIEPSVAQVLLNQIRQGMERFNQSGTSPILIASPTIRRHVKKLTERFMPNLVVLSHSEIPPNIKIQSLGVINLNAA
ncbi:MAG TPA: FHIPEP family type III secretion protein, partial [Geobacterales bacterium]|nr:FHIPEP family type III secretion protein [Geobacterales bacterium]